MRVGNFCLIIPQGRERESGHVAIAHGTQYTIQMRNYWHDRACDAELTVDGKPEGGWRIPAGGTIILERPVHDTGRFTFYKAASEEAKAAGVDLVGNDDRGLIVVRFKPEFPLRHRPVGGVLRSMSMQPAGGISLDCVPQGGETVYSSDMARTSAGITGLSGHSNQQFVDVAPLTYDMTEEVLITVRLVCDESARPLTPQQVTPRSNAVPAPVG